MSVTVAGLRGREPPCVFCIRSAKSLISNYYLPNRESRRLDAPYRAERLQRALIYTTAAIIFLHEVVESPNRFA